MEKGWGWPQWLSASLKLDKFLQGGNFHALDDKLCNFVYLSFKSCFNKMISNSSHSSLCTISLAMTKIFENFSSWMLRCPQVQQPQGQLCFFSLVSIINVGSSDWQQQLAAGNKQGVCVFASQSAEKQSNGCHGNSRDKIWDTTPRSCKTGFPVRRHGGGCVKILVGHAPHHLTPLDNSGAV